MSGWLPDWQGDWMYWDWMNKRLTNQLTEQLSKCVTCKVNEWESDWW